MPTWHCRHSPPSTGACEGSGHRECGLRYSPGEFRIIRDGVWLEGIGTLRMSGVAFAPKTLSGILVFRDGDGNWVAEFEATERVIHHRDGNPYNHDPRNLDRVDPRENRQ